MHESCTPFQVNAIRKLTQSCGFRSTPFVMFYITKHMFCNLCLFMLFFYSYIFCSHNIIKHCLADNCEICKTIEIFVGTRKSDFNPQTIEITKEIHLKLNWIEEERKKRPLTISMPMTCTTVWMMCNKSVEDDWFSFFFYQKQNINIQLYQTDVCTHVHTPLQDWRWSK